MLFGACQAAQANGVITIVGSLTDTTCRINGQEPPHHILVTLPRISASSLKAVRDVAGATRFTIRLTDCPVTLNGQQVSTFFEHGPTTDFGTDNLLTYRVNDAVNAAATAAPDAPGTLNTPVQIQILNANGTPVLLGREAPDQQSAQFTVIPIVTVDADTDDTYGVDMHYLARYMRTAAGAITAGHLVSYVRYSIVYP